jgi:hypothetical protein
MGTTAHTSFFAFRTMYVVDVGRVWGVGWQLRTLPSNALVATMDDMMPSGRNCWDQQIPEDHVFVSDQSIALLRRAFGVRDRP